MYIPYSIRHNITDPDLAGLLDYLERDMGWEMIDSPYEDIEHAFDGPGISLHFWHDGEIQILSCNEDIRIPIKLFYRIYKTLLPVIRDLYAN